MIRRTFRPITVVIFMALMLLSAWVKADTFHDAKPKSELTTKEAALAMKANKVTYRCRSVYQGDNINPKFVKGSKYSWHSDVGTGIENVVERLSDGKPTFKCESVYIDPSTARVRKAG